MKREELESLRKIIGKTIKDIRTAETHGFLSNQEIIIIEFTDGTQIELKVSWHI